MSIFNFITLLGGLAMFLYGMRLMGDSLKENSSGTLKAAMELVTNNPIKAFILGMLVTALIQSSTATIVITSGLVGAGILTLHQSLGIIVGANVGTTVTGQIIRLLDLDPSGDVSWLHFLQPSTLAPLALIFGMTLIMSNSRKNSKSIGNIAIGFGILFSGLLNMTGAVNSLTQSGGFVEKLFAGLGSNPILGYLTGAGIAFVLQSSSATIGILQAFSSTGLLTFKSIYAVIVGIYLGDCVTTAIVCSIGAKADSKRVGIVNILFNLSETVTVLAVVTAAHRFGLLDSLWDSTVNSGIIANTNTIFNLSCALLLFPMLPVYEKLSRKIIHDDETEGGKFKEQIDGLNPVFVDTPALALRSCYQALLAMLSASWINLAKSFRLLESFNEKEYQQIMKDETQIDNLTDHISRYIVELLPRLQLDLHTAILNQYYKNTSEFERLGDHAVNIADHALALHKANLHFSDSGIKELRVLESAINDILGRTEKCFRYRDIQAAYEIQPLVRVINELIGRLKRDHLKRMSQGECSVFADPIFTNLTVDCKRIADICSNVGIATVVRLRPELADHEHLYFDTLHEGGDEDYNRLFGQIYDQYFSALEKLSATSDSVRNNRITFTSEAEEDPETIPASGTDTASGTDLASGTDTASIPDSAAVSSEDPEPDLTES
jgi:phosphate:Na+ symporter